MTVKIYSPTAGLFVFENIVGLETDDESGWVILTRANDKGEAIQPVRVVKDGKLEITVE